MSHVFSAMPYWLHLLAMAVFLGSQVMLFVAVMPAVRTIDDQRVRGAVMRSVTQRFGYLGWGALLLLVLTGVGNIFDKDDQYQPVGVFDFDFRYAWLLMVKIALTIVIILLTAWHSFVHGPRMLEAQEAMAGGRPSAEQQERQAAMRRLSIVVSVVNLLIALAIVYLVTLMQDLEFAFAEV